MWPQLVKYTLPVIDTPPPYLYPVDLRRALGETLTYIVEC